METKTNKRTIIECSKDSQAIEQICDDIEAGVKFRIKK